MHSKYRKARGICQRVPTNTELSEQDQIYFVDGVNPQHNTIANYGWIKKGKTKQLKTNNGRQRTNIKGLIQYLTNNI